MGHVVELLVLAFDAHLEWIMKKMWTVQFLPVLQVDYKNRN
jgi:hypothetical protein